MPNFGGAKMHIEIENLELEDTFDEKQPFSISVGDGCGLAFTQRLSLQQARDLKFYLTDALARIHIAHASPRQHTE